MVVYIIVWNLLRWARLIMCSPIINNVSRLIMCLEPLKVNTKGEHIINLVPNTKGTSQSSKPLGFPLGSRSKVWKEEVVPMWHHFPAKSRLSSLKKIVLLVWEPNLQAWVTFWVQKEHPWRGVLKPPKFLGPYPNVNPPLEYRHGNRFEAETCPITPERKLSYMQVR